ncbi:DNA-binding protein [Haloarcula taiwanensis]|uniref:DNA-binding protein n=1 Tax=Haloarcula taiwanensis TaxID=1932004 RepID=A0A2H5A3C7_9EURY|nr:MULTISPECIES: helix-turn-helix domain-containing protein [Haloarcula]AUG49221.1 DNA-binding protein [Haloarcula taiwanensis]RLM34581.1 DNA-binding protein [Haloarcula sp. Atlit-120R]RLM43995.1 DNA-binding protein [Haloarcula sp. Atlit-47R]RLM95112.1 DNA-binding protein [Haloarcula sp. Atlit-7R]
MSITTKIHIEHERLALVPTLQNLGEITIRVITQGNTDPGSTVFPFLIEYHDRERLEEMLDADPTVQSYDLVDWTDQTGIYYIEHTPETKLISSVVTDVNGFLVHTETKGNGWLVRLLLPDRDALNTIWEYANENDISLDIIEIYGNTDTGGESSYGLTDEQRTALTTAYENGYFGEPRDISLNEVADEIGLSSTAMSGRLRRGMRNLIAATLIDREK